MSRDTRKRRSLIDLIESSAPLSIYGLARLAGRNYRRVHDHVHELASTGQVRLRREVRNGRRVALVEGIANQRLAKLDELFALRRAVR